LLLGGDAPDLAPVQSTVSMSTVVAVAIALLVALLIVIDVSCYFVNACGLTMCVCVHLCGRESTAGATKPTADKDVDDPERYVQHIGFNAVCSVFCKDLTRFAVFCASVTRHNAL